MSTETEPWRMAWRHGIAPLLSDDHLKALRQGLAEDDPALIQGSTAVVEPDGSGGGPGMVVFFDTRRCAGACAIGYAGWRGEEMDTVAQVSTFFTDVTTRADSRLNRNPGEWAAGEFLEWFDENDREYVRVKLLAEVNRNLAERAAAAEAAPC